MTYSRSLARPEQDPGLRTPRLELLPAPWRPSLPASVCPSQSNTLSLGRAVVEILAGHVVETEALPKVPLAAGILQHLVPWVSCSWRETHTRDVNYQLQHFMSKSPRNDC